MYICLLLCGALVVLLRQKGLVFYMLFEASLVGVSIFLLKFNIYKERMDKVRAIFNIVILSLLILMHILSQ